MNPEDLLTDALHDRVERTDYPSTPLSAVAGRAGALRARRRRTTALAAAAAVAVVVVPFGAMQAGGWFFHTPAPAPTHVQPLDGGPSGTSTPQPVVLEALPLGQKPGIDYLVGNTYVTMSGDRITSPAFATAGAATPVRGGILTAEAPSAMGPLALSRIALVANGQVQQLGCGSPRFAMSTDAVQSAYWLADSCPLGGSGGRLYSGANNTMGGSVPAFVETTKRALDVPVGIVQQGVVVNDIGGDRANGPSSLLIAPDGTTTPLESLAVAGASDENNDVVSGQLSADTSTGAVIKVVDGSVVCRTPGWQLGQFSTDGKYVLGVQPADGFPDGNAVFDASTCQMVIRLQVPGATAISGPSIGQLAWDVDDTVLAVANSAESSAIVRFDLQGHLTRATPVADTQSAYRLATRP